MILACTVFCLISPCDGQTDLQTDRQTDGRTELRWLRRAIAVPAVARKNVPSLKWYRSSTERGMYRRGAD